MSDGNSTVYNTKAPKNVNYVFFSAPNASSPTLSTGSSVDCQYGNDWTHSWNDGVVTTAATTSATGVRTYTCSVCGETETETIPQLVSIPEDEDNSGDTEDDAGYAVTFATDGNCSINVYYKQSYTAADETGVTSAVSRNGDSGSPDSSGDGQVNFTVVPSDGYTVSSVTATEGAYKNIKDISSDAGVANTYRITKITAALTVTVTTTASESETVSISVPVANTGLKYTGNEQTGVPSGTGYTLSGTYAATNVGDYTAVATPNAGYVWTDGGNGAKEISWSIARANGSAAPTGLSGVAPTTENGSDGQITGTSTDMEYSASSAFSSASDCSANATTGLSAGTYYVRYKQTATTEAGAAVAVTVPAYNASGGSGNSGSGDSSSSGGSSSSSGGCYVATSVYGSYDCPEVWTLRRFRDNVLAETWYGRLFIRAYYAVSPTAVKLFGNAAWFQNFWRGRLDNLVSSLQADGFESTPYEDQSW